MTITDNKGVIIKVADLPKAIEQAQAYARYQHTDESLSELDKELQGYWSDVLAKLLKLK